MFKNYFKIAWRTFFRYKVVTLINLAGLAIVLTCCLMIGLYVWDELQFDKFHKDGNLVYRIYDKRTDDQGTTSVATTPPVFATVLKNEFPEVDNTLRMLHVYENMLFELVEEKYYEEHGILAEPAFFNFFTLPLKYGNAITALAEPMNIVLSAELAEKYFGNENPLGKTISINKDNFRVTAVMQKIPLHFH